MFSTDQSHLRRYLTTLGVAIAAGTLSLAGLFLKLEQDLLVTTTTLGQLTPTARSALLERQRYLAIGTAILPYFVLVGFVGGLSLAAYGLNGWRQRQKVTDALEDLALQKGRVEFRQMTAQEQAEKLNREAVESVADISQAKGKQPKDLDAELRRAVSTARERVRILETSLSDKLRAALGRDRVQSNITITEGGRRVPVDALATVGTQNIVIELKYITTSVNPARVRDAFMQVDDAVAAIDPGRSNTSGAVIFVIPDDMGDIDKRRIFASASRVRGTSRHHAIVMKYEEFLSVSPDDLVSKLLEDGEGVSPQPS